MGRGNARFGRKGQKTPKIETFGLKVCSLGPRGDPHMRPRGNQHGPQATRDQASRQPAIGPQGNPHGPQSRPQLEETSYTTPQETKEEELVERYPPLLPGVWYSSFPIIAACFEVRAGCLEVSCAGRLEVPGNKVWDQNFQF